jgi:stearoyl-CoA desaturase (delta-9 desaturase)
MGGRRFATSDDSRNSFILSLITLGEGWHNNHHRYMSSTRQGFYWWELDITYYILKALSWTGFIWDLKPVPASVYREAELRNHQDTLARFSISSVQHEIDLFRRAVPTAAAIALATVQSPAVANQMKNPDGPAVHKNIGELIVPSTQPISAPQPEI